MRKILVCDDLPETGVQQLRAIPGVTVSVKIGLSEADLKNAVADCDAIVVRSATKITAPVLEAAKNLKAVIRAGMGYDNIDVEAATRRGVVVMNTPGSNSVTTAEHTIAMVMALARNIPQAHMTLRNGKWDKKSYVGTELAGKTLGIVGLGNVGRQVAMRAKGLKMEVLGYDPFIPEKVAAESGASVVTWEALLTKSDFITLHSTLTDQTKHMINAGALRKMKPGVRIINCARGGLIDEAALAEALESGLVAGAALDVFEEEPPPLDHPLLKSGKVVVTPHLGASTTEAQEQVVTAAVDQLRLFLVDEMVVNGVNVPSVSRDILATLGPYIDLAGKLGAFLGQLDMPPIEEIRVECSGDIVKNDTAPIALAAVKGVVQRFTSSLVNFVNAPIVAKERGIRVVESRTMQADNYLGLVTVTVKSGKEEHSVAGSVFGRKRQRLVKFDHYYLEVVPEGTVILIENEDRPGVVGAWGTILGRNKINISQMQVGLDAEQKRALSIVNVDSDVPQAVLDELRSVANIRSVRQIRL